MNGTARDKLYNLLPSIYRIRDSKQGEPLRALMSVIEDELRLMERDIEGLYDNWFIETCEEWVVPYIGNLLGVRGLHPGSADTFSIRSFVANTLAYRRRKGTAVMLEQLARDVTGWNTRAVEYFKLVRSSQHMNHVRSKNISTPDMRNVNTLQLLDTPFDSIPHTADVRQIGKSRGKHNIMNVGLHMWRLSSYFLNKAATCGVISTNDNQFTFSSIGSDIPLFNRPQTETEISHLAEEINVPGKLRSYSLYKELEDLRQSDADGREFRPVYFGEHPVFEIYKNGILIPFENILIADITEEYIPPKTKSYLIPGDEQIVKPFNIDVAVDPVRGRLAFHKNSIKDDDIVQVSYAYGFSGDLGGGPYDREIETNENGEEIWKISVLQHDKDEDSNLNEVSNLNEAIKEWHKNIEEAMKEWHKDNDRTIIELQNNIDKATEDRHQNYEEEIEEWQRNIDKAIDDRQRSIIERKAIITFKDSGTYDVDAAQIIRLIHGQNLIIQAAKGCRPLLRILDKNRKVSALKIKRSETDENDDLKTTASLTINGLLIEGSINIADNSLAELEIIHTTLVPSALPSIIVEPENRNLELTIDHSILGSLRLSERMKSLVIRDGIIDVPGFEEKSNSLKAIEGNNGGGGPSTEFERVTIFGEVHVRSIILATEVIFNGKVTVIRRQKGCIRYSYIPEGSLTPKRFRCQPDLALLNRAEQDKRNSKNELSESDKDSNTENLLPGFVSTHFGEPEYGQLSQDCSQEIKTGGENNREMGAFNYTMQPQREVNLKASMDDYLRFGIEAGTFYVT